MWAEYGFFLLKWFSVLAIIVLALLVLITAIKGESEGKPEKGKLVVRKLNEFYQQLQQPFQQQLLTKKELKQLEKSEKLKTKQQKDKPDDKGRVFVLSFTGDVQASQTTLLEKEVSAILSFAKAGDEALLRLESGGGVVHGYGLAASQLQRLRDAGLKLTVCVDKVAASGGYMMAVVGQQICAAPFAIIGSIGVMAQIPNFHRLLKKHDVDVELHTAGKFKRTLTSLGENTEEGREKFRQDLERIHQLFKQHVQKFRRVLDIDAVADGDIWLGSEAVEKKLVDRVITSEQLLQELSASKQLISVQWQVKKTVGDRLQLGLQSTLQSLWDQARFRHPWH